MRRWLDAAPEHDVVWCAVLGQVVTRRWHAWRSDLHDPRPLAAERGGGGRELLTDRRPAGPAMVEYGLGEDGEVLSVSEINGLGQAHRRELRHDGAWWSYVAVCEAGSLSAAEAAGQDPPRLAYLPERRMTVHRERGRIVRAEFAWMDGARRSETYGYDDRGRVASLSFDDGEEPYAVERDAAGRVVRIAAAEHVLFERAPSSRATLARAARDRLVAAILRGLERRAPASVWAVLLLTEGLGLPVVGFVPVARRDAWLNGPASERETETLWNPVLLDAEDVWLEPAAYDDPDPTELVQLLAWLDDDAVDDVALMRRVATLVNSGRPTIPAAASDAICVALQDGLDELEDDVRVSLGARRARRIARDGLLPEA